MFLRNRLLLLASIVISIRANRTKRDIDALIRGGFQTDFIKTCVAIIVNQKPVCSGTLISNEWVLTAGHCVPNTTNTDIEVVAGETNLLSFYQGLSKTGIKTSVKNIKLHPNFKSMHTKILEKDLALLELEKPIDNEKNPNIEVAFLPPPLLDKYDKTIRVGGWGLTEKFTMSTNHLSIDITIKNDQECLETFNEREYNPEEMFCAGSKIETTCPGDSGAGGILNDWGISVIVVVVSFGKSGCKTPSVYTNVAKFLPWIFRETKLKPASFIEYISSCLPPKKDLLFMGNTIYDLRDFSPVRSCTVSAYSDSQLYGRLIAHINGSIMICGGKDPSVSLWTDRCFSLKDGVWTQQPSMLIKREYGVAATTDKGFLVSGGYTSGSYQRTDSTEYFISGTWVKGPTLPVAMTGHCLIPVGTSAIIAGGLTNSGITANVYMLKDGSWQSLPSMKHARDYAACVIWKNELHVMGGFRSARKSVEIMNLATHQWRTGPNLPSSFYDVQPIIHNDAIFLINVEGIVVKLLDDKEWQEVGRIGKLVHDLLPLSPHIITPDLLGCN